MANEITSEFDYNSIPLDYYDRVFHRGKGVQSAWHQFKFRRFKTEMGQYGRHLDIGCGPGTFIGILDPQRNSIGVDISEPQLRHAIATYQTPNHLFQHIAKGALPFADGSFDAITIIELIEHLAVAEIDAMLSEARRVLAPGGRLFLSTPNYGSFWPILEKNRQQSGGCFLRTSTYHSFHQNIVHRCFSAKWL
jgi:2-polyprenyl-3-methyl-5-hydroxy-6-metoxy-1,4-benzoquinol methylase